MQELVVGALAAVASFVAGLLGAGGDILYVPLLLYALPAISSPLPVHSVTALSLVGSLASTGGGGLKYWRDGRLDMEAMRCGWRPLAVAALAGGALSRIVPSAVLLAVFAVVTTAAALLLLVPPREELTRDAPLPRDRVAAVLLAGAGMVCGAVGVGGGFLIIAVLLHRMHLPVSRASTTGLALTAFTAAPALAGKVLTGQLIWGPVPFVVAGALGGVWLGARAGVHMPARVLRWALAALVTVLGVRVWFSVWGAGG